MKIRPLLLCASLSLAVSLVATSRAEDDVRFSRSLPSAELTSTGVASLNSDQTAILDALVRRDVARSRLVTKQPRAARFSQRLSDEERHNAGIDALAPTQVTALDESVERLITPPSSGTLASVGTAGGGSRSGVESVKIRRGPEIHGSVELMVGVGSNGYSEYGGAMTAWVENPQHNLVVAVSYAELHTKGGYYYRGCRDGYLPWSDPLRRFGDGY